ncbi:hypothetical protein [Parvibaculum sp.]|uniref:hypothetical protein n=1 Tax=Parvibaculum sp. TaxID=2024848 RepID=UPI003BAADDEE
MDAILHIGVTKTGTTTIQRFLRENRQPLSGQGVFVPMSVMPAKPTIGQHVGLTALSSGLAGNSVRAALSLRRMFPVNGDLAITLDELRRDFVAEMRKARGHRMAILSAEGLNRLEPPEVTALHDLLSGLVGKLTVLIYLRRQDLHAVSRFSSILRVTNPDSVLFRDPPPPRHLFDELVERYAAVFGRENIMIRLFQPDKLAGGDALSDFRHVCGIEDDAAFTLPERQNEKLSARQVAFLHHMLRANDGLALPSAVRQLVLDMPDCGRTFMPARAEAEAYYRQFTEGNARIARDYFGTDGPLFDEDFSMYPQSAALDDCITLNDMAHVMVKHLNAGKKIRRGKRKQKA